MTYNFNFKLMSLFAIFIGLLVGMNLMGGKITTIAGISMSVAIFMVPVTFLITDVVSEVYGRKLSQLFTFAGMLSLLILLFYSIIFVALVPNERYPYNAEYGIIFGTSLRIIIASILAFTLSQIQDIWLFEYCKRKTGEKYLWLRTNLSTFVSQTIDTLVFMFIAFYHVAPKFDSLFILKLALPYLAFKIALSVLSTPFVYLGVKWLRAYPLSNPASNS